MKSLIIDDEHPATLGLTAQLKRVAPQVEVVGSAPSVEEAEALIQKTQPELVFLDIMLLDGTGFDLLERFEKPDFSVIFTTAYDEYAVRAFRFAAVDYLLKPISAEELSKALDRLPGRNIAQTTEQLRSMMENRMVDPKSRRMAIPEASGIRFVQVAKILRVEADSNYSLIFLENGEKIVSTRGLRNYEELLEDAGFFRCHKSFIVNLRHITRYNKGRQPTLEISDGTEVPVARNSREPLMDLLQSWTL